MVLSVPLPTCQSAYKLVKLVYGCFEFEITEPKIFISGVVNSILKCSNVDETCWQ